jgi:PAS domain S-box-containing protein
MTSDGIVSTDSDLLKKTQKDNDYYRSIIENNSFYVVKTNLEGKYTFLNRFFCDQVNSEAEDWIGKSSFELIIPEDHEACLDTVHKCFADPSKSQWVMLRKPMRNGITCTQWEFKLLTDDQGNFTEFLCLGHDITPLMKKQEELQRLVDITAEQNKRLVNFTYIISHNIRSHIANTLGIINVNELDDDMDNAMALNLIKNTTVSLDETVKNLNEIISVQSNTNLPIIKLNVCDEIKKIVQSIQMLITDSNTVINYKFDHHEMLSTNASYFESIILNLLTNSIKYRSSSAAPEINIAIKQEGRYKVLTFADNGMGIDMEKYRSQLFGMYKTFHGNQDAKGMGLFIIKTQIEAMKGKIEVESTVGVGTTFSIYFPENEFELN